MGLKSVIYFEIVTTLALFIGLAAINLTRAGEGLAITQTAPAATLPAAPAPHWDEVLLHVFPENIAKSVAENQILQVAVFAFLFGLALLRVPEAKRAPMVQFCESLTQTMFSLTRIVMYYAPIGVGAALAYTVGHMGISVLLPLCFYHSAACC
jgi:proton glutamate symport protein